MPAWALALAYTFHLLATVLWVGGLAMLALVVWPAARARLGAGPEAGRFLADLQRRFNPLAWFSLAVLGGTGMLQMTANRHYDGFLTINSPWAAALLVKHAAILAMVVCGAATQWWVQPQIARLNLLAERGRPAPDLERLRRRELWLLRLNLAGALLTLVCTAIATAQP